MSLTWSPSDHSIGVEAAITSSSGVPHPQSRERFIQPGTDVWSQRGDSLSWKSRSKLRCNISQRHNHSCKQDAVKHHSGTEYKVQHLVCRITKAKLCSHSQKLPKSLATVPPKLTALATLSPKLKTLAPVGLHPKLNTMNKVPPKLNPVIPIRQKAEPPDPPSPAAGLQGGGWKPFTVDGPCSLRDGRPHRQGGTPPPNVDKW